MAIPVNPVLIAGAVSYTAPFAATPLSICSFPAEGARCIPMQFLFSSVITWLCDMSLGLPQVSQVSCMYIDNTNSSNGVVVIFPDTGYEISVAGGKFGLYPVFTQSAPPLPKFYVASNAGLPSSDYVNIILLNFFVPEFNN